MNKYRVIIPAAGKGKRMKMETNKQFLELKGEPLIVHTVRMFEQDNSCQGIVLVANQDECVQMSELIKDYGFKKVTAVIKGGKERQDSVNNGLAFLNAEQIVLIHDGARPFITAETIAKLVLKATKTGAATVAVRAKDTMKRVVDGKVIETLNRDELWSIQTPQAFKLSILKEAHKQAKEAAFVGTDDASLVEWFGHEVDVVEGDYDNIKLTTSEDLLFAEAIIQKREQQHDKNRARI